MESAKHRRPSTNRATIFTLHFVFQTHICRMMGNCASSARSGGFVVQVLLPKSLYTWSLLKPGLECHWKSLGRAGLSTRPAGETRSFPLDKSEWLSQPGSPLTLLHPGQFWVTVSLALRLAGLDGTVINCGSCGCRPTYSTRGQAWEAESRVSISCQVSLGSCLGSRAVDTISTKISISLSWEGKLYF